MIRFIVHQVSLPTGTAPQKGDLWDSIFGPLSPLISTAWYVVLHWIMPVVFIISVAWMVVAGLLGNQRSAAQARGAVFAVPKALFFVSIAVLVSNWILSHY